jgi:hypothetical protein
LGFQGIERLATRGQPGQWLVLSNDVEQSNLAHQAPKKAQTNLNQQRAKRGEF